jgi:hypothetical protein
MKGPTPRAPVFDVPTPKNKIGLKGLFEKAKQIGGVVGKIGIHLANTFIVLIECPLKTLAIRGSQTELAFSFNEKNIFLKLLSLSNDLRGSIWRMVIDNEDIEARIEVENTVH